MSILRRERLRSKRVQLEGFGLVAELPEDCCCECVAPPGVGRASTDGDIIEALGRGVTAGNISKSTGSDYVYVRIEATDPDRAEMAAFAHEQIGWQYGVLTIASIVLSLLTTARLRFGLLGTEICSGLVARMLERGTYIWVDPASIMPADLASFFNVPGCGCPPTDRLARRTGKLQQLGRVVGLTGPPGSVSVSLLRLTTNPIAPASVWRTATS